MRKGTGYPTSQSRWLSTSVSLTGTPQRTDRIWDIPLLVITLIKGSVMYEECIVIIIINHRATEAEIHE